MPGIGPEHHTGVVVSAGGSVGRYQAEQYEGNARGSTHASILKYASRAAMKKLSRRMSPG